MNGFSRILLWVAVATSATYLVSPVSYLQFRKGFIVETAVVGDTFPPVFDSWYEEWMCFYNRDQPDSVKDKDCG